jgi:hypothetical protein
VPLPITDAPQYAEFWFSPAMRYTCRVPRNGDGFMEAIRRVATVKNHRVTLDLPENFDHHRVEVIILPCAAPVATPEDAVPTWQEDFLSISCWGKQEPAKSVQSWPLQTF